MSGRLTTHVLNLARGVPAVGMALELWKLDGAARELLRETVTNSDGRLDIPLLEGSELVPGSYELLFMAGNYFRGSNPADECAEGSKGGSSIFFLEQIPIRFNIINPAEHCHVPLLVAPGGYSTYRGS
ncbi:5-hydroxyisourate hydrolase [Paenibacillus auburnensis]|uniref:5-hydroxyisourate hydrolase n=1 Tax=Paenibacillus auburnensis TaxID=2905649 RepID=A0ABN8GU06_9BACL|nr:hydroxyisourate hydrolase [Paenibacillus auburnensis]CAH1218128.1 5-hydroxyisourate hydrolase [Paenibacillus auburnensis]